MIDTGDWMLWRGKSVIFCCELVGARHKQPTLLTSDVIVRRVGQEAWQLALVGLQASHRTVR